MPIFLGTSIHSYDIISGTTCSIRLFPAPAVVRLEAVNIVYVVDRNICDFGRLCLLEYCLEFTTVLGELLGLLGNCQDMMGAFCICISSVIGICLEKYL